MAAASTGLRRLATPALVGLAAFLADQASKWWILEGLRLPERGQPAEAVRVDAQVGVHHVEHERVGEGIAGGPGALLDQTLEVREPRAQCFRVVDGPACWDC